MTIVAKYDDLSCLLAPKWQSDKPSKTVPDQTLSVRELLERFTTGLLTPQSVWRDDVGDDFSDLDNPNPSDSPDFDLVDKAQLRDNAETALAQMQTQAAVRQRRGAKKEEEQTPSESKSSEKSATTNDE